MANWITQEPLENGNIKLRCYRCGETFELKLPTRIREVELIMQGFLWEHRDCEES